MITQCVTRETLRKYLAGQINSGIGEDIEEHLADCSICEQTVTQLEAEPDTLWNTIRKSDLHDADSHLSEASDSDLVQRAIESVKRLDMFPALANANSNSADSNRASPTHPNPNQARHFGAYELLQPIGRGGMGVVMLARHRQLNRMVAIKLLPALSGDHPELVQRFQREILATGKLQHPSIVNATDAGYENGTYFLAMEHISGLDLSRTARLLGPMPIADACEVIRQAAVGLAYSHAESIVHRDIKPSNLMLDNTGRVKILDFGLAQLNVLEAPLCEVTTVGQLMGTIDYMAPEQAQNKQAVDHRADLYSLAATLFRLIVGRAPLAATPNMGLLEKVKMLATETAPSICSLRKDCPVNLAELIGKTLSREASDRPDSAAELASLLEPFCIGHQLTELSRHAEQAAASAEPSLNLMEGNRVSLLKLPDVGVSQRPAKPPTDHAILAKTQTSGRSNNPWKKWLLLAAGLPFFAATLIWFILETNKGQLVIQSDIDGLKIRVKRDEKVVETLSIQQGTQMTRLRADQYVIELDHPSDQIIVDQSTFTIQRGETVVARVRLTNEKEEDLAQASGSDPAAESAVTKPERDNESIQYQKAVRDAVDRRKLDNSDPNTASAIVYEGRSYQEWKTQLQTDLSSEKQMEAFRALAVIGGRCDISDSRSLIVDTMNETCQSHRGYPDYYQNGFFALLSSCGSHEKIYEQFLAKELVGGSHEWRRIILREAVTLNKTSPRELVEAMIQVLRSDGSDKSVPEDMRCAYIVFDEMVRLATEEPESTNAKRVTEELERFVDKPSLWSRFLWTQPSDYSAAQSELFTQVALTTLQNEKASPEDCLFALEVARRVKGANPEIWIDKYLARLAERPERRQNVFTVTYNSQLELTTLAAENGDREFGSEAINCLRIIRDLGIATKHRDSIRKLLDACSQDLSAISDLHSLDFTIGADKGITSTVKSDQFDSKAWAGLSPNQRVSAIIGTFVRQLITD